MSEPRVRFLDLRAQYAAISGEIDRSVADVFRTQGFVLGPTVQAFEDAFARYLGARVVVGVASGTDALYLSLRAAGIGRGDAVLTSAFSFVSTATAIERAGARPYFVDIDPESFNLEPSTVERWIDEQCHRDQDGLRAPGGERLRGIIPVHLFGRPCEIEALAALAKRHGLAVVEDAAQSAGARAGGTGRFTGAVGRFGCFSFYPTKNLGGAGDGGAVACADVADAALVRSLARHGVEDAQYRHERLGLASRLDALQAAVLSVKLGHLDRWNDARRRVAARYGELLRDRTRRDGVVAPAVVAGHVFHQYVVRVAERDRVRALLAEDGIETQVYYPMPLHLQPCFADLGHRPGDLPEAERASREALALPIYPELRDDQIEAVVTTLVRAVERPRT